MVWVKLATIKHQLGEVRGRVLCPVAAGRETEGTQIFTGRNCAMPLHPTKERVEPAHQQRRRGKRFGKNESSLPVEASAALLMEGSGRLILRGLGV